MFMAKPTVTTRGCGKFVCIKIFRDQGPAWTTVFRMSAPVDALDDEISWKRAISKPLRALKNAKSLCLRQVTRGECTSKSNSVDTTGSSAAKKAWAYFKDSHRKINIAQNPTNERGTSRMLVLEKGCKISDFVATKFSVL